MASLGVMLLWLGWFGFNGGSTLGVNNKIDLIIRVITNTVMAGSTGMITAVLTGWFIYKRSEVDSVINGGLAGLVAITANCHVVSLSSAAIIGAVGGIVMLLITILLEYYRVDDAVGAVPVHLGAGIWGTIAVGLFGKLNWLDNGLSRFEQIQVQLIGVVVCFMWAFTTTYILLSFINRFYPLRVSLEDEQIGLNISEHGAHTDLLDLFVAMDKQAQTGDLSLRVPVEPFTEVGQIAKRYNQVMKSLEEAVTRTNSIVRSAMDAIITFSKDNLSILTLNPAAETIFGYSAHQIDGKPVT